MSAMFFESGARLRGAWPNAWTERSMAVADPALSSSEKDFRYASSCWVVILWRAASDFTHRSTKAPG